MIYLGYLLLVIYCISISCIIFYSLLQLDLYWAYHSKKIKKWLFPSPFPPDWSQWRQFDPQPPVAIPPSVLLPKVTVQLPIYNEQYVAGRLIDNIVQLDYPPELLQIQVLDDSIDNTSHIIRRKVLYYQSKNVQIVHLQRDSREGFKAGALRDAMPSATGAFIAIFDADFLPPSDFLRKTLPYFDDPKVAVVQGRWAHLNERYSLLTRLQALQLNVHFTIEQAGRQEAHFLLQFNGTAGVWRKSAIEDAGGWQADTLTEDLDLSYRAQLKTWRIVFLENLAVPSELPVEMNALKAQQFRWMKGGAENARKLLAQVWQSDIPTRAKIHATQHLLASSIFAMLFISAIISLPLMLLLPQMQLQLPFVKLNLIGFSAIWLLILNANLKQNLRKVHFIQTLLEIILLIPLFIPIVLGLSLHNSIAVWEGFTGKKSDFVRTPKYGMHIPGDHFWQKAYLASKVPRSTYLELLLSLLFLSASYLGATTSYNSFWTFHLYLGIGFGAVGSLSIYHLRA